MKHHSFFWKLLAGNLLVISALAAIGGLVSYGYLNAGYQAQSEAAQDQMTRAMERHFGSLGVKSPAEVHAECMRHQYLAPMRLTVIAPNGHVLGDSEADERTMRPHKTPDRPEVLAALDGRPGCHVRLSETLNREFRYLARPIRQDGKVVGAIRLAMPIRTIEAGQSVIRNTVLWATAAGAAAAAAQAQLISWLWSAPLKQIAAAAAQIASGDLAHAVKISATGELADLAEALDRMRRDIAAQVALIAAQRQHLQTAVSNLREGVVALDGNERVVLMNDAAAALLGTPGRVGAGGHLRAVIASTEAVEACQRAMAFGRDVNVTIAVDAPDGPRTLDCHAARIDSPGPEGIRLLLVAHDVTDVARTADIKTRFVANASHELRTPLATLRAAVDSLAMIKPADGEALAKLTAMLDRHVGRLEQMTRDLLDLHAVETGSATLDVEDITLDSLRDWAESHFAAQAEDGGVSLAVRAEPAGAELRSDRRLMQLIMENLLDNALKFTPPGGRVECELMRRPAGVVLRVADTGCGIEPELHDRIFERFFQADASRSGKHGRRGTGLGLAIVKYAAERLAATVRLESIVGRGTTFVVEFPLAPGGSG